MKYINNKSLVFPNDITIEVTRDLNFLLRDVPPYVRGLINKNIKNIGRSKNIDKLRTYLKRFPNVAFIYKMLADEYTAHGKEELYIGLAIKFHKKFPDDFFAKLHRARAHMLQEQREGVSSIYGDNIDLAKTFPDRRLFHIAEMLEFYHFCVRYCLSMGLLDDAIRNEMKLGEVEPNGSTHQNAKRLIEEYKRQRFGLGESGQIKLTTDLKLLLDDFDISGDARKEYEKLHHEYQRLKEPSPEFLVKVQIMVDKYDEMPFFKLLIMDYQAKFGDNQSYANAVEVLFGEHPDFLFGKIEAAQLLLGVRPKDDDKDFYVKEVLKMFGGDFNLKRADTKRNVFHIDEFTKFHFLALRVWLRLGDLPAADDCLKLLENTGTNPIEAKWGKELIDEHNDSLKFQNRN